MVHRRLGPQCPLLLHHFLLRRHTRRLLRQLLLLDLLDAPPLNPRRSENAETRHGQRNRERLDQRAVVRLQHPRQRIRAQRVPQLRRASANNGLRPDVGRDAAHALDELVGEDVLADGDEDGAAELLGEEHDGDADGDVLPGQHALDCDVGLLHAEAEAEAEKDLVADPVGVAAVGLERGEHASADGGDDGRGDEEGRVVAEARDEAAGDDAGDDEREDERDEHEAGVDGVGPFDGLEPDWHVIHDPHHCGGVAEGVQEGTGDGSLLDDAGRDGGVVVAIRDLDGDEGQEEECGKDQEYDDASTSPRIG